MSPAFKWGCAVPFVILIMLLTFLFPDNTADFRFRLAFTVEVDGVEKTASSIVNVHFYGIGTRSPEGAGKRFYSRVQGVAPVMDLGPGRGWLVAGLAKYYTPQCKPVDAFVMAFVFGDDLLELPKLRDRKVEIPEARYPQFIWFPPDASYIEAQIVCPADFAAVIGSGTKLKSVTRGYDENLGFVAKAYEYEGKIYIAYRGTDDGSLDVMENWSGIMSALGSSDGGAFRDRKSVHHVSEQASAMSPV